MIFFKSNYQKTIRYDIFQSKLSKIDTIRYFSKQIIKNRYDTIFFKTNYQKSIRYDNFEIKLSKFDTIR